jgi:glycosyltransferase involved in cell wall biosynthesis
VSQAPLVTIVTALYKAEKYVGESIESALTQSFPDFELIVSNDGDDSEARKIVASFSDPRLSYRSNPKRLGAWGNHLSAFQAARGKYIAILNHDDILERDFLRKLLLPMEEDDTVVLSFCDHFVVDAEGAILREESDRTSRRWKRDQLIEGVYKPFYGLLRDQSIPMAVGTVFRRAALTAENMSLAAGPAYDLWLTYLLSKTGGGAYYCPERLTRWRVHPQSITSKGDLDWTRGAALCWEAIKDDPSMGDIRGAALNRAIAAFTSCAIQALRVNERDEARHWAKKALSQGLEARAAAALVLSYCPRGVLQWALG